MEELSWYDTNSLNAIAGYLRHIGHNSAADVLHSIQAKVTHTIEDREANKSSAVDYIKTANVTNTKNVLVQVPAWVVKRWGLQQGDKLEVCYNATDDELCIKRAIYTDIQGRSEAAEGSH